MRLCVVTFKECWQGDDGAWLSYGGFPAQMASLASLFAEVVLVVTRGPARGGGMPLPAQARVVPLALPAGVNARRKLSVLARLPYYLANIRREVRAADVVHAPVPGDLPFLGLVLAQAMGKRVFCLYNGSWVPNAETTIMNRVTRQWMRTFGGSRSLMLAVGDDATPPAPNVDWLFATALSDHEVAHTVPDLERGLGAPARLVYLGRLSVEKGVPVLLEAFATVLARLGPHAPTLQLIGGGPERAALELAATRLGCAHAVHFAGQLARDELSAALLEADLCVHASHTEGYCKAWLDAMAHGLPVLTTEVGAARGVVGSRQGSDGPRGWLVPPARPDLLADALTRVLTEPRDWPRLRAAARAYAAERTVEAWAH
jgi:glycosyltransferase involved in cell wall biosynthesis